MAVIDKELPFRIFFMKVTWLQVTVVIGMTISLNYWLLVPTIITAVVMYFFIRIYIKTSRSVKRIDGISK